MGVEIIMRGTYPRRDIVGMPEIVLAPVVLFAPMEI